MPHDGQRLALKSRYREPGRGGGRDVSQWRHMSVNINCSCMRQAHSAAGTDPTPVPWCCSEHKILCTSKQAAGAAHGPLAVHLAAPAPGQGRPGRSSCCPPPAPQARCRRSAPHRRFVAAAALPALTAAASVASAAVAAAGAAAVAAAQDACRVRCPHHRQDADFPWKP
jgi:hypothetical protein